jgi:hypothetical protein
MPWRLPDLGACRSLPVPVTSGSHAELACYLSPVVPFPGRAMVLAIAGDGARALADEGIAADEAGLPGAAHQAAVADATNAVGQAAGDCLPTVGA